MTTTDRYYLHTTTDRYYLHTHPPTNYRAIFDRLTAGGGLNVCEVHSDLAAETILAALNRPTFSYQEWRSTNDVNGNPRRVTMVFSPDGEIVAALDQGYSGDRIPDARKTPRVVLPSVNVSPAQYRDAVKGETLRCAARKYLAAGGPTETSVISYGGYGIDAFEKAARKLGVKDYSAFKSAVWECERFERAPWAAEYKAVVA